jgi:hypothetical protein
VLGVEGADEEGAIFLPLGDGAVEVASVPLVATVGGVVGTGIGSGGLHTSKQHGQRVSRITDTNAMN